MANFSSWTGAKHSSQAGFLQSPCHLLFTILLQASFKAEISEGLEPATSFQAEQKPLMMVCLIFYKTDYSNDYYTQQ